MHAQRQTSDVALWNRIKARIKDWIPADPIGWGDRMRRRDLLLSALGVSLLPTSAPAQGPDRVWRVGVLRPTRPVVDLLRQFTLPELARLGFVEGRNLALRLGRTSKVGSGWGCAAETSGNAPRTPVVSQEARVPQGAGRALLATLFGRGDIGEPPSSSP